ncbi:MAG: DUF4258 domain-containing protein [Parvibaculum sp.]|uniref:DUF4258 domain-containing protein n=1 Tax=Parvibaculum sp. TaxID=2024848 RepID=UPI002ABA9D53|nr:DUF4258 domain-containing protein [Parvibaculum sp.]MDZ4380775.1 DUF4258 domain-containing protein [Parvibaculum sp.]
MADVVPLQLTADQALRMIREMAADTNNIVVISHAKVRGKQRRISRRQIEACVQKGVISEGPFMNMHGNWQVNLERRSAGEEVTCVVAIEWSKRLIVVTTF